MKKITIPIEEIFDKPKPIIGVVHLPPLPGSPNYSHNFEDILETTVNEAKKLETGGVDGLIVENFWDSPFKKVVDDPLTLSAMTLIVKAVINEISIPVGVNLLRNSAIEGAAISHICGGKFIRVNVYVETIATDSGVIEPAAPTLMRYLSDKGIRLGILADVNVKHGAPIGTRNLIEVAFDALERGNASAIIITGERTGFAPDVETLLKLRESGVKPVFIGSGLGLNNIKILELADGAIVGTYFKKDGVIANEVDLKRVKLFMEKIKLLRKHD